MKTKRWLILFGVLLLAGVAIFAYDKANHIGEKVYGEAAGHKIYKSDIDDLLSDTPNRPGTKQPVINTGQATLAIMDKYLLQALAGEQNFSPGQQEVQDAVGELYGNGKVTKYQRLVAVNGLYTDRLGQTRNGYSKGKYIVARFDRYIPFNGMLDKTNPKLGDPSQIAMDRAYAQDFINTIYSQLQSKQITIDQAIDREKKDPQLGDNSYNFNDAGSFDTSLGDDPTTLLLTHGDPGAQLAKMHDGELSKPLVAKVLSSEAAKTYSENYFMIIQLDHVQKPAIQTGTSTQDYIIKARQRLGYHIYV